MDITKPSTENSRLGSVRLTLPYPVSVNRLYRAGRGRVYKSDEYKTWIAEAHVSWLQQKHHMIVKSIKGRYRLCIDAIPPDKRRRDAGNLEKSVSDFLQAVGVIENDSLSKSVHVEWDDDSPPTGNIIVTLTPYP